ncbi:competence protein CoiA family protein [Sinorhizobium sp. CCBAU 05631]|uniref:competence protein CoiA n=1 Tax=Sinorhizobium sp. CCBAU 05631 TaxID=794846 RepID=UPI00055BE1DF|nr:competence protein CoiA family protein [Sinorhizobium sp. CCBAU 05631]
MKYSFVDGIRLEARPGIRGVCPVCNSPTIPKCGLKRLHHWAHVTTVSCDHWWEPETEWHRAWKEEFPAEWQESRHVAADGEIHIADVKTATGTVLEFQHSPISPNERASREGFYGRMAWFVNGTRLKKDLSSFQEALTYAWPADLKFRAWGMSDEASAIIERWRASRCPVLVDFGDGDFSSRWLPKNDLLWLLRYVHGGRVIATPVSRQSVIEHYLSGTPIRGFPSTASPPPRRRFPMQGFEAYLARRQARRPRF